MMELDSNVGGRRSFKIDDEAAFRAGRLTVIVGGRLSDSHHTHQYQSPESARLNPASPVDLSMVTTNSK